MVVIDKRDLAQVCIINPSPSDGGSATAVEAALLLDDGSDFPLMLPAAEAIKLGLKSIPLATPVDFGTQAGIGTAIPLSPVIVVLGFVDPKHGGTSTRQLIKTPWVNEFEYAAATTRAAGSFLVLSSADEFSFSYSYCCCCCIHTG